MTNYYDLKKARGTYILLLEAFQRVHLVQNPQQWIINPGYYLYFGSAKGKNSTSLGNRLKRHLNRNKKIFWHIDYLTTHQAIQIVKSFYKTDPSSNECNNLETFSLKFPGQKIKNFGNSDCKNKCGSHLIFIQKTNAIISDLTTHFQTNKWQILDIEGF